MKRSHSILASLLVVVATSSSVSADVITHFGDFFDTFGGVGGTYDSAVAFDPGAVVVPVHEAVVGLEKFDPALGTLTDIEIFVTGAEPIKYMLGGAMTVTETATLATGYGATVSLTGVVELNYLGTSTVKVLEEVIPLSGAGAGTMGTGGFTTGITPDPSADGFLSGSMSVFGGVDLADFVGAGEFVDKLFVDMIVQSTADFTTVNSSATGALGFDVFAGLTNPPGSDVIGVMYTYDAAPVPEPSSFALLAVACGFVALRRRAKKLRG